MNGLQADWILAPAIDLELKQYVLLGYLQRVQARFDEHKLYPHLDELRGHLERLVLLRRQRTELLERMGGDVVGLDLERAELVRARHEEHELLRVIDALLTFAIPELQARVEKAEELRNELAAHIQFGPVGLLPLDVREGYLLLRQGREARAYRYRVPLVHEAMRPAPHRTVRTQYLASYAVGLSRTYAGIRAELMRTERQLPVPATFFFEAGIDLPRIETFMPLAKQLVHRAIERLAA